MPKETRLFNPVSPWESTGNSLLGNLEREIHHGCFPGVVAPIALSLPTPDNVCFCTTYLPFTWCQFRTTFWTPPSPLSPVNTYWLGQPVCFFLQGHHLHWRRTNRGPCHGKPEFCGIFPPKISLPEINKVITMFCFT